MLESKFQSELIERLKKTFVGCVVLKNDSGYLQGIPDLTVFYQNTYAILEVKRSASEPFRPNQEYYLALFAQWVYAAVVHPDNVDAVINDLIEFFD